jgi:CheY-like chemotaxis protein
VTTSDYSGDLGRRRFVRFPVTLPLVARAAQYPGKVLSGTVRDIGRGGVMAEFPVELVPGSQLRLILQTRTGPLDRPGAVVWTKNLDGLVQHGIAFPEPEPRNFAVHLYRQEHGLDEDEGQPGEMPPGGREIQGPAILVVDDDAALRDATEAMLEVAGYPSFIARDGREAVSLLRMHAREIALILLDFHMPGENTPEVFDEFMRIAPQVPVLLMSGEPEEMALSRFGRASVAGFLYKPQGIPRWIEAIERLAGKAPGI